MSPASRIAIDLLAISVLCFGLYFPRHRRRDVLVAFFGVNVGVLAVTTALLSTTVGAGVGLGLFGVLSIIRLRSAEMDQSEVAYYFAALTLGILGGFDVTPLWLGPTLVVAVLLAVFVADHPALFSSYRNQLVTLDRAFADETELRNQLEDRFSATVHRISVRKVDFVEDTTMVEVRFRVGNQSARAARPTADRQSAPYGGGGA